MSYCIILYIQGILDPFTYIASHPGNGMRERLLHAFNVWMDVPQAEMEIIANAVGMLHNASLMLDDIEDSSQLRRGKPAAHTVYGIPLTELGCLHHGQGLDIIWRDSFRCRTEAEYIDMVKNKTGGLLRIGVKLMMASSTTKLDQDYVTLVDLIGVFYQIRDDYLNLRSPIYSAKKGFAEDVEEGKFSFPIVHGVQANISMILDVLRNRPATLALKTGVIQYLEHETKSFDYTVSVLDALQLQIGREIEL
ncbi:farnesyltranstransferase [Mycena olivaceomarginata]|nr:farnesyltranstransferase [Mycena olivaceomarginata]